MRIAIRLGVIAAAVLASSVTRAESRGGDDHHSSGGASSREEATVPSGPAKDVFEPGAASLEPTQAVDEEAGTPAHQAWVESIHDSP